MRFETPCVRSPSGAPVPASAAPMSKWQLDGGSKEARIHRSTGPGKFFAAAQIGGAGLSRIQRWIFSRPPSRLTFGGVSWIASLPKVAGWTYVAWVASELNVV